MTEQQLKQGHDFHHRIQYLKDAKKSILDCIRELELESYSLGNKISLKLNRKDCYINKKRIIKFLNIELETTIESIVYLELEFKQL